MRKLPATMSLHEVERRAARLRWRLLLLFLTMLTLAFVTGMIAIWTADYRWLSTALLLFGGANLPILIYRVIKTPELIPRMAEHYREHGVKIEDDLS